MYDPGLESWRGQEIFLLSKSSRLALRPSQSPTQWVHTVSFPEERHPGHEADYPPPSRAKVNNEWSYDSPPPYAFIVWTRYIYFYVLPPRERVVFITNRKRLVFTEIIGIGIYRENHRKYRNTRSNGKQTVHTGWFRRNLRDFGKW